MANDQSYYETFWFRFARKIMRYLCTLSFLDLHKVNSLNKNKFENEQQDDCDFEEPKPQPQPLWAHLVRIFYVYVAIKATYNLYLQHDYDYNRELLARYLSEHRSLNLGDSKAADLLYQVKESRARLKSVGAPYMGVSFILELAYIYMLAAVNLCYLVTQIGFHYKPIDLSLFRYLMDPKREQFHLNRLIRGEVDKFVQSRKIFFENTRLSLLRMKQNKASYMIQAGLIDVNSEKDNIDLTLKLYQLMADGDLQPITRRLRWMKYSAIMVCLLSIHVMALAGLFVFGVAIVLPASGFFRTFRPELDPLDVLFALELYSFCAIGIQAIAAYLTLMGVGCTDQIKLVSHNTKNIFQCIEENDRLFYCCLSRQNFNTQAHRTSLGMSNRISTKGNSKCQTSLRIKPLHENIAPRRLSEIYNNGRYQHEASVRMNVNLMRCLMQYKIFVVQLRLSQGSSSFAITITLILMTLVPVAGRYYASYMPISYRFLIAGSSLFFICICDVYFTCLCHLNSECLRLCRALSSLLAHTVQVSNMSSTLSGQSLVGVNKKKSSYDSHLVCLLRKELSHPERIADQFAPKALGFRITYTTYVRIHFWLGLLILSIVNVDSSGVGGSFGFTFGGFL